MNIPAWVRHLAFHPVTVVIARLSLGVIAVAFTGALGYLANTNTTIANVQQAQTETKAANNLRFEQIESKVEAAQASTEALGKRVDLGREDRIRFQDDTTVMLRTIIGQNQTILANQAASAVRMDNFDQRLKRIEDNGAIK